MVMLEDWMRVKDQDQGISNDNNSDNSLSWLLPLLLPSSSPIVTLMLDYNDNDSNKDKENQQSILEQYQNIRAFVYRSLSHYIKLSSIGP